jgi:hypothetical protein
MGHSPHNKEMQALQKKNFYTRSGSSAGPFEADRIPRKVRKKSALKKLTGELPLPGEVFITNVRSLAGYVHFV